MNNYQHLFSKSLAAAPNRLHFAAHSHHLWPDASFAGQVEAWTDAATLADTKWDRIMGPVWDEAQRQVAAELHLPNPSTVVFAPNTHQFVVQIVTALPAPRPRILATDGEFHSFRRQAERWAETGTVELVTVPAANLLETVQQGGFDLVWASQVLFNSGQALGDLAALAALAAPDGPWVMIDGYHGFMAIPTDLSAVADSLFYTAGGYKYAMSGEGVCFLHAPPGYAPRPKITGWYAAFDDLAEERSGVGYAPDARRFLGSTFDPSGLYRFNAVRRMLDSEGLTTADVSAHCDGLKNIFLAANPLPQFALISAPAARFLAYQSAEAAGFQAALSKRGVVTDVRGDVLRIGFGLYQNPADVERLLAVLAELD